MILTGWKEIGKFCGIKDKRTIKRKAREFSMPILKMNGRPTIEEEALRLWWVALQKKSAKNC